MLIFPIVQPRMYFQGADTLADSSVLCIKSIKTTYFRCSCKRRTIDNIMSIKKEYRIELESVNAQAVVEETFVPIFLVAGCEIIFGDNDKKLHSVVTELF